MQEPNQLTARDLDFAWPPTHLDQRDIEIPLTATVTETVIGEPPAYQIKMPPMEIVGPGWMAIAGALGWISTAAATPIAMLGWQAVQALPVAALAGWGAAALAPAILILNSASAAREAHRTRRETMRLTAMAAEVLAPGEAAEARARRLGFTVRSEIGALQHVMDTALDRLMELETAAARNAETFNNAVACANEGAGALTQMLGHERHAIQALNQDLSEQTEVIGQTIGRQVRMMREATRLVRCEFENADDVFQNHLTQFAASAALMHERTEAIDHAAQTTLGAVSKLDNTMSGALDALAQASSLTDTARQSADAAALAANATASAVRDTTQRAVADARRVAQMIRQETEAMEASATETLSRLKMAAEEAHRASAEAQAAADMHATSIQRRLAGMADSARAARTPVKATHVHDAHEIAEDGMVTAHMQVAAGGGGRTRARAEYVERGNVVPNFFSGQGSTGNLGPMNQPANDANVHADAFALNANANANDNEADRALHVLSRAGVRVGETLTQRDLDAIAQRARNGAGARRTAVQACAAKAIDQIRVLLTQDSDAFANAKAFRAKPQMATASGDRNLLVAYLLLDTAMA
jgi:hypothetical protein